MANVLAVIHHRDPQTTFRNADIAVEAGCRGVFLIQMEGRDKEIEDPAVAILSRYPMLRVGTNRLNMRPADAVKRDVELGLSMTWADNPGVYSDHIETGVARLVGSVREAQVLCPTFQFFGSVAFKTHRVEDPDPGRAAVLAADLGFVPTTSGPGTGYAPDVEKLAIMKKALGDRPLAVASGITPENAPLLAPYVKWVLVATGISQDFYNFDPDKVRKLVQVCSEA